LCSPRAAIGVGGPAHALDPNSGVSRESGPFDLFKFGFSAYKKGRKDEAVEAYKYAAEKGHPGARWALANMYAYGDGVVENDYEAFKIYDDIARQGVEPGSQDTGYFVNALLSLANYYQAGIPGQPGQSQSWRGAAALFPGGFGVWRSRGAIPAWPDDP
jgi:TPR repeat protein